MYLCKPELVNSKNVSVFIPPKLNPKNVSVSTVYQMCKPIRNYCSCVDIIRSRFVGNFSKLLLNENFLVLGLSYTPTIN